jgi:predicted NUDIX family phosphoesterase
MQQTILSGCIFVVRRDVEKDLAWKQIIPWIVIQTPTRTAIYQRAGAEKRLQGLWSVGIGGHVNSDDARCAYRDGKIFSEDAIKAGMRRELDEELPGRPAGEEPKFCGVINDDSTETGRHHLGLVFKIDAADYKGYAPGEELKNFKFVETLGCQGFYEFDQWSKLSLDFFSEKK